MKRVSTVIVGGGQAGLAMSRCLSDLDLDHVVLERGRVAERWRSERWDSLRLLTPNWQSRLPGWRYQGADPDGFMSMPEVVSYLEGYARSLPSSVQTRTTVLSIARRDRGYRVGTDRGTWLADNVVIATGHCMVPRRPGLAASIPPDILQLVPTRYRNPRQLPEGKVLIVGASATGIQLADEIQRAGRDVTLAVGRHIRLPRRYRGVDIMRWLDAMGALSTPLAETKRPDDPSLQLVGDPTHRSLDLGILRSAGVRLVGRALGGAAGRIRFDHCLPSRVREADEKLLRLLGRIDDFAAASGLADLPEPEAIEPLAVEEGAGEIDLRAEGFGTVVWATGFLRRYPWLHVDALDECGEIRHRRGVASVPGLYVLGLQFQRRRGSSFIDGVGADARELAAAIAARSGHSHRVAA